MCKAPDFHELTWRHRNLFQHHFYVIARVPRVDCPDHGTKQVKMPWAREGSRFTLLFEQAAMTLAREMPVRATARIIGVSDTRLWRVIQFYVTQALPKMDLGGRGCGFGRNCLQTGPQLRHRLHRSRPQAKADHLRYPRQGQRLPGPIPPLTV
ncbi:hypothetical protein DFAR_3370002 [Desulfarculales bacterium]